MISDILLTLFLVFLNGFFVAAEFAIVKVRQSQIDLKVSQGSNLAPVARHITDHLDAYLSATQLGITLASLGLGWIGEPVVGKIITNVFELFGASIEPDLLHSISLPVAFVLITILHIVLGELAPKGIAIRHPLQTTMAISLPLKFIYIVFRPFIWLLNGLANLLLKAIGVRTFDNTDVHTEEELRLILTESEEGGAIKSSEHELIQNVFEFDDRVVKHIYVPRSKVAAIDIEDDIEKNLKKLVEEGYSRTPVYKESIDNIVGIMHSKDLIKKLLSGKITNLEQFIRPAYYVPMSKRVNDLLREFQRQHIQMAIVTNEFGGTEGIVTMEDIIEELVGEIQDEYDEEKPVVERKSDTEFIVNATASISDVNDLIPRAIEESSDYETVSGYVNYIFGGIPAVNDRVRNDGYEITILKRHKQSVESVGLRLLAEDEAAEEDINEN
jgi:CBS domain containing-hemolysin-like protein